VADQAQQQEGQGSPTKKAKPSTQDDEASAPQQQKQPQQEEPGKGVSFEEALGKISKALLSSKKYSKAAPLLLQLLQTEMNNEERATLVHDVSVVFCSFHAAARLMTC
jgi:hypothetical protein